MSISRDELGHYCDQLLNIKNFKDYAPNGLQVEGRDQIQKVVCGVTASQALIDAAIAQNADAIIVHHGYFWKGEDPRLIGMKARRIKTLMQGDISLFGYHLPLDAHADLGNNAGWAKDLGLNIKGGFAGSAGSEIALYGDVAEMSAQDLAALCDKKLGRAPLLVEAGEKPIRRIGICTGGAQGFIDEAADLGLDAYLSGEVSEQTTHIARERGIHFLACGHHATERYGPKALAAHLNENLDIECIFIDVPNPM